MPMMLHWRCLPMRLLLLLLHLQQRLCNEVPNCPGHKPCAINPGTCQFGVYVVLHEFVSCEAQQRQQQRIIKHGVVERITHAHHGNVVPATATAQQSNQAC
jgi:hypothetical protein